MAFSLRPRLLNQSANSLHLPPTESSARRVARRVWSREVAALRKSIGLRLSNETFDKHKCDQRLAILDLSLLDQPEHPRPRHPMHLQELIDLPPLRALAQATCEKEMDPLVGEARGGVDRREAPEL